MKLELDSFLKQIYSWKTVIRKKDSEIELLKNEIRQLKQNVDVFQNSNTTLLQEIAHFNIVVSTLHQTLAKVEEWEVEKKAFIEEKIKLKTLFEEHEKIYQSQITELKEKIERLKALHKEDIKQKLSKTEVEVTSKLQDYLFMLKEKEDHIFKLEDELSSFKSESSQEILKIKIEYEEKLCRLKNKITKHKKPTNHHDLEKNDIFRQKYVEKEREAREESIRLKKEIEELQRVITSLKSRETLTDVSRNNIPNYTVPPGEEINVFEQSHLVKRQKLNNYSDDDFTSVNAIKRNSHKQLGNAVHHFKKKLFNVDMNYFDQ